MVAEQIADFMIVATGYTNLVKHFATGNKTEA